METRKDTETMSPGRQVAPPVDIYENSEEILMLLDVPGVTHDSLDLRIEDRRLDVEARQKLDKDLEPWLQPATFVRSFTLPTTIDDQRVAAELEAGVLRIRLPKAEHAKPRRIPVKQA